MDNSDNTIKSPVFALDIGTHSVIGVVGYNENELFHIEAIEEREHTKRAMIDGQIEDIAAVAAVAIEVREALEAKVSKKLDHVCVAAAGRALRTATASFEVDVPAGGPATKETVYELEMGAVSKAAEDIHKAEGQDDLFCVGHSVMHYYLDDYAYSTIIDHKGKKARVDIIATFLPSEVVSSLEATMQKAGLSIEFLTLEPIAAMNAVIPQELRLLNLALVDIGAGTSDIAVCNDGAVSAYTMATVAGDEITEAIIKQYLVDFDTAEKIKCAIGNNDKTICYRDIMGFDYTVPRDELLDNIMPSLDDLADIISTKILEINGKSPAAVFLVGGGGRTPLLCKMLADKLELDERKVAIGGNNFMKKLAVGEQEAFGPEYATPLGIALTAVSAGMYKGFDIMVNGEQKHLLRTGSLAMMDVLLLCGYSYADIMGKSGKNLLFEVNGQKRILRGGSLQTASLLLNGESVGISALVASGDSIHVVPAVQGEDASLSVRDVLAGGKNFTIGFDNRDIRAGIYAVINGVEVDDDRAICVGDKVEIVDFSTFSDVCKGVGDGKTELYLLNGMAAADDARLEDGDIISLRKEPEKEKPLINYTLTEDDIIAQDTVEQKQDENIDYTDTSENKNEPMTTIEEEPKDIEDNSTAVLDGWEPGELMFSPEPLLISEDDFKPLTITLNGTRLTLPPREGGAAYMFLDMLSLAKIDPSKPEGDIELLLNGHDASFLERVNMGDEIEIHWKQR